MKIVTVAEASQFTRVLALETTASFLALPVPCVPGPMNVARGREALGTRMYAVKNAFLT